MKKINIAAIVATLGVASLAGIAPVMAVSSASTESQVFVNVAPVIDLSVVAADDSTNIVKMNGTPGDFVHNSAVASVTTNSRNGYYLLMESRNNYTDLRLNGGTGSGTSITSLTAQTLKNGFAGNQWGYFKNGTGTSVDATYFQPIPAKDSADILRGNNLSDTTDTANYKATNDQTTVTFGVKIGANLTSGTYSNVMRFTAITKYVPTTLADTLYLQDLTPTICAATTTPAANATTDNIPTNWLRDARDGKYYAVRKLADGNCWMVDDLALATTTLTASTSDVSADYTMPTVTAGAYTYDVATVVSEGASLGTICPAGWTLPIYSDDVATNGSVDKLSETYKNNLTQFDAAFGTGSWWTKTAANASMSYALGFNGSAFTIGGADATATKSLRCYVSGS